MLSSSGVVGMCSSVSRLFSFGVSGMRGGVMSSSGVVGMFSSGVAGTKVPAAGGEAGGVIHGFSSSGSASFGFTFTLAGAGSSSTGCFVGATFLEELRCLDISDWKQMEKEFFVLD